MIKYLFRVKKQWNWYQTVELVSIELVYQFDINITSKHQFYSNSNKNQFNDLNLNKNLRDYRNNFYNRKQ